MDFSFAYHCDDRVKAERKPIVHRIKYYRMSEYGECTVIDIHSRVHTQIVNHSYFLSRAYTFVPSSIFRHFDEKSTRIARCANYLSRNLSRTASGSKRFKRISGRDSAIMFTLMKNQVAAAETSRSNFDLDDCKRFFSMHRDVSSGQIQR